MSTDTFLSWYTVIDSFLPLSFWVSVIGRKLSITVYQDRKGAVLDFAEATYEAAEFPTVFSRKTTLREVSLPLVYVIFCEVTL